eukprot:9093382-Alexandrium_andersonii.AAC.1
MVASRQAAGALGTGSLEPDGGRLWATGEFACTRWGHGWRASDSEATAFVATVCSLVAAPASVEAAEAVMAGAASGAPDAVG